MKKNLIFLCMTLIFALWVDVVLAQTKTVTGVVRGSDNTGLVGVNVVQKGTTNGTSTSTNGAFKIAVPEDATLVFTFIGLQPVEAPVKGKLVLDIQMESYVSELDEVVLIGYQSVHKRDVTAAVTSIKGTEMEHIPMTSISTILATQTSGLQTISFSGAPGARGSVIIRGNTSISGDINANTAFSNPLYVVDGVQTSLVDLAGPSASNLDFLSGLNPSDVESIDILKDASAAAIYGSRGANGVIIINTKKGKALDKPEFVFNYSVGVMPKPKLVPMLVGAAERREKMRMIETWWLNEDLLNTNAPVMLTDSLNPAFNNNVDYQGLFYQTGVSQKYSLSMRGGAESANYRLSMGYDNDKGTVIETGLDRYTFSGNINSKVGKRFNNQLITRLTVTDNKTGQGDGLTSILPTSPASLVSSLFTLTDEKKAYLVGEMTQKLNTSVNTSTTISDFIQFDLFKGLTLNSQLSFVYAVDKNDFYEPSITRTAGNGSASYSLDSRVNTSTDTYLSYYKDIGEHNVTAIAGVKSDYNKYESMGVSATGFGSDAIQVINSRYTTAEENGSTDISENAMLSYFGRFSYKFKNRYIIGGNISFDGSSRFGTKVRWATFPSISTAWILSDEPFIKPYIKSFVDFAKLKFSWGINGNQFPENYLRYGAYSLGYGGNSWSSNQMVVSTYAGKTGVIPNYNSIGNDKLAWENTKQWDLGFELDMFKQLLSITFDAYHKQTDQLFFDITFPEHSGYNTAKANVAGILNYGWEAMIKYQIFPRTNKLRLEISVGFSQNKNYVTALPNGNKDYVGSDYGYIVGRPINLYKAFVNEYILDDISQLPVNPFTGLALTGKSAWAKYRPGFPVWKDFNNDYVLNENPDEQIVPDYSPVPIILGALNLNLQYKSWYMRAYSQFSFGNDIKNTVLQGYMDSYDRGGTEWSTNGLADLSMYNFWKKPGDGAAGAKYPAMYPSGTGLGAFYSFRSNQTLWIEPGDYWKITNASFGYTFEKESIISKIKLTRLTLYGSVMNLWQWQKSKSIVDATMVDAKGQNIGNGYPQPKIFSLGLDLRF